MKNIIILFLLLILPMLAYSQDVIITKKAEKLEVKIIEVSSSEIKYKKLNNLEGPTFVLLSSDVASIIYENGDVQVFEETSLPKNVEKTSIMNNIIRNGNKYIFDGVVMRGDIYSKFLKENCTVAYNQYTKGRTLANVGFLFLGLGLSLDFIAIIPILKRKDTFIPSCLSIAAGCLEIACIPTLIVGYNKMHKSADIYNSTCAKKHPQAYWSINASQNGIGLAFNF